MGSGIPYDIAVKRGICGAQRKNEDASCQLPRDEHGHQNGRCNYHGSKSLVAGTELSPAR
ncbi:MAG: hypothetical protein AVDCRST_MAG02-2584 [uncultured Rubrobacteraceae bacterium]|uniref:Uncharacterized protein n=1 Tax=uncultured Rubrobacteraceae bacterium TaxID=349277 RepID=A0A6J4R887_9ACTN|nr:MAG: hypothetical protein AVDCRST_MAG02-2584 [uncultured Rubrobacteraceae bacterium]